jgi:hypothetical protein
MASKGTETICGPINKTAQSTVDVASSEDGGDQIDNAAIDKVDAKEERAFVCGSHVQSETN